jgi:hypothetical protein
MQGTWSSSMSPRSTHGDDSLPRLGQKGHGACGTPALRALASTHHVRCHHRRWMARILDILADDEQGTLHHLGARRARSTSAAGQHRHHGQSPCSPRAQSQRAHRGTRSDDPIPPAVLTRPQPHRALLGHCEEGAAPLRHPKQGGPPPRCTKGAGASEGRSHQGLLSPRWLPVQTQLITGVSRDALRMPAPASGLCPVSQRRLRPARDGPPADVRSGR